MGVTSWFRLLPGLCTIAVAERQTDNGSCGHRLLQVCTHTHLLTLAACLCLFENASVWSLSQLAFFAFSFGGPLTSSQGSLWVLEKAQILRSDRQMSTAVWPLPLWVCFLLPWPLKGITWKQEQKPPQGLLSRFMKCSSWQMSMFSGQLLLLITFSLSVLYGCGSLPSYDILLHDSVMLPWSRVPARSYSLRASGILCWWQTAANSLAGLAKGVTGCFCPQSIFYRRRLEWFGSRNQYFSLEPLRALHPIACSTH